MPNYPTSLDDATSLKTTRATGDSIPASDHNDLGTTLINVETKLGIGSSTPTTTDHVLKVTGAGATAFGTLPTHTHVESDVTSLTTDLAAKAPLASPTFTGTVAGITKSMVGLGSVDNTADASKTVAAANALKSATTTVDVSAATAPTSGQVLTATGGTAATWQTPAGGGGASTDRASLYIDYVDTTKFSAYLTAGSTRTNSGPAGEQITRAAAAAAEAQLQNYNQNYHSAYWDWNPAILWVGNFSMSGGHSTAYATFDDSRNGTCFGFKAVSVAGASTFYAVTSLGGVETTTAIAGLSDGTNYSFYAKMTSGTNVKFYVDKVLVATHTTNLGSGTLTNYLSSVSIKGDGTNAGSGSVYTAAHVISYDLF